MKRAIIVLVSLGLAIAVSYLAPDHLVQTRKSKSCLSILTLTALWWIFEPFPSYVTSLAVIPLCVGLGIIDAKTTAAAFFDPVMFLFISGFSLAQALDKHGLTQKICSPVMKKIFSFSASRGGDIVLHLGVSVLCLVLSALVSNVAASVLMAGITRQMTQSLHLESRGQKRLALTVAFACNIGGMVVPLASPQNLVAISVLKQMGRNITFLEWLEFALPACSLLLVCVYIILRRRFGVTSLGGYKRVDDVDLELEASNDKFLAVEHSLVDQWLTGMVAAITVTGWCLFDIIGLENFFGHMGIFGIVGVVVLHAFGLVNSGDWQNLPWPVLTLLGGGMALGAAVEKSGLLTSLAGSLGGSSNSAWWTFFLLISGIAIIANFLSSTVCALIAFPVMARVGVPLGYPKLFTVAAALMTSGAMALPVSSFPNANAAAVKDQNGNFLLRISDYTKTGFPVAVICLGLLLSAGFFLGGPLLDS